MKIEIKNLKKYFGKVKAVDNISFTFYSGQIFGFVGPNGAGKTTTMRILATLEEPSDGDAYLDNISVVEYPEKARHLIGYVPDSLPLYRDITVHEYLDFFARAYGIKGNRRISLVESIEEFTNLSKIKEKLVTTLSKGMKQRVSVARALIHDPPVLIMDEPAAGLDPHARIELRELLKALSKQGKAILISSHILTELSEICDGAVFIEQGKLLTAGTLSEIVTEKAPKKVFVVQALEKTEEIYKQLLQMPYIELAKLEENQIHIEINGNDENAYKILHTLIHRGYKIVEFKQVKANLEEIFMKVTKGEVQ